MNEEKVTSETITFASQEFGNIRVLDIDGQPWFVGKDVANYHLFKRHANGYYYPGIVIR